MQGNQSTTSLYQTARNAAAEERGAEDNILGQKPAQVLQQSVSVLQSQEQAKRKAECQLVTSKLAKFKNTRLQILCFGPAP